MPIPARPGAVGLLLASALLTHCSLPQAFPPPEGRERLEGRERCIFTSAIGSWRPLDSRRLLIFADREYAVELLLTCPSLETTETLGFVSRDGRICGDRLDEIQTDRERCRIGSIQTVEEAQSEPPASGPP